MIFNSNSFSAGASEWRAATENNPEFRVQ